MSGDCPRLFEAEAWRDGRLHGAEVARFQAHLKVCPACAREVQSLAALGEALRAPLPGADELQVRRERTRLLAALDAQLVPTARPRRYVLWLGMAGAVAAMMALAFALRRATPPPATVTAPSPPAAREAVSVRADSSARWSRQAEAQLETVALESGTLSIKVDHAASPRRLRVILPDGELEDIGTTFSVSADAGHTTRVSVQEGSVVLRLRGKPPLALGAGDAWSPTPATSPSNSAAAAPVAGQAQSNPSSARAVSVSAKEPDASAEFRAAMQALNRGDNAEAAALFRSFVAQRAGDSRAEDAAYLRVLALQRSGNTGAMQQAAREYLHRYPHGFRKAEIEPLVAPPD